MCCWIAVALVRNIVLSWTVSTGICCIWRKQWNGKAKRFSRTTLHATNIGCVLFSNYKEKIDGLWYSTCETIAVIANTGEEKRKNLFCKCEHMTWSVANICIDGIVHALTSFIHTFISFGGRARIQRHRDVGWDFRTSVAEPYLHQYECVAPHFYGILFDFVENRK